MAVKSGYALFDTDDEDEEEEAAHTQKLRVNEALLADSLGLGAIAKKLDVVKKKQEIEAAARAEAAEKARIEAQKRKQEETKAKAKAEAEAKARAEAEAARLEFETVHNHQEPRQQADVEGMPTLGRGARARVRDLDKKPQYNGEIVYIIEYVEEIGRWRTLFRDGQVGTLLPQNLEPLASRRRPGSGAWSRMVASLNEGDELSQEEDEQEDKAPREALRQKEKPFDDDDYCPWWFTERDKRKYKKNKRSGPAGEDKDKPTEMDSAAAKLPLQKYIDFLDKHDDDEDLAQEAIKGLQIVCADEPPAEGSDWWRPKRVAPRLTECKKDHPEWFDATGAMLLAATGDTEENCLDVLEQGNNILSLEERAALAKDMRPDPGSQKKFVPRPVSTPTSATTMPKIKKLGNRGKPTAQTEYIGPMAFTPASTSGCSSAPGAASSPEMQSQQAHLAAVGEQMEVAPELPSFQDFTKGLRHNLIHGRSSRHRAEVIKST